MPRLLDSPFIAWGLAGLLMLVLALLAFLRSRRRINERLAVLIIAVLITLVLFALTMGIE